MKNVRHPSLIAFLIILTCAMFFLLSAMGDRLGTKKDLDMREVREKTYISCLRLYSMPMDDARAEVILKECEKILKQI